MGQRRKTGQRRNPFDLKRNDRGPHPVTLWQLESLAMLAAHRWGHKPERDQEAREAARGYGFEAQTDQEISTEAQRRLVARCQEWPEQRFYVLRIETIQLLHLDKDQELADWLQPDVVLEIPPAAEVGQGAE